MTVGVAASLVTKSFKLYLRWRNYRTALACNGPPECFDPICTDKKLEDVREGGLNRSRNSLLYDAFDTAVDAVCQWTRLSPYIYYRTAAMLAGTRYEAGGLLHGVLISVAEELVRLMANLPFAYFVARGVGKKSSKVALLCSLLVVIATWMRIFSRITHNAWAVLLARYLGNRYPLYVTGARVSAVLAALCYGHKLVEMESTPLGRESRLYKRLTDLALPYKWRNILVADGDQDGNLVFGFGSYATVIIDSALRSLLNEDQMVATVAREMGRWMGSEYLKRVALIHILVPMTVGFISLRFMFDKALVAQFGYREANAITGYAVLSDFFFPTLEMLTDIGSTLIFRRFEFQADRYAASRGFGLKLQEALVILRKDRLHESDWLYRACYSADLSTAERIAALKRLDARPVARQRRTSRRTRGNE